MTIDKLMCMIRERIPELETKFGFKILIAGITSSYSRNIQSTFSDFDCNVVASFNTKEGEIFPIVFKDKVYNIDYFIYDLSFLCLQNKCYFSLSELEKKKYEDRYIAVGFETFSTKYQIPSLNNLDKINFKDLFIRDNLIHYYAIRAKGNWINMIKNNEYIDLKKYLITIHNLLLIRWIEMYANLPKFDILALVDEIIEDKFLEKEIYDLVTIIHTASENNSSSKYKVEKKINKHSIYIEPRKELNNFILSELKKRYDSTYL